MNYDQKKLRIKQKLDKIAPSKVEKANIGMKVIFRLGTKIIGGEIIEINEYDNCKISKVEDGTIWMHKSWLRRVRSSRIKRAFWRD